MQGLRTHSLAANAPVEVHCDCSKAASAADLDVYCSGLVSWVIVASDGTGTKVVMSVWKWLFGKSAGCC